MIGRIHFMHKGHVVAATLTDAGAWECPDVPPVVNIFGLFRRYRDTSPSLGDPDANHINAMAELVKGTAECAPREAPEGDVVY